MPACRAENGLDFDGVWRRKGRAEPVRVKLGPIAPRDDGLAKRPLEPARQEPAGQTA